MKLVCCLFLLFLSTAHAHQHDPSMAHLKFAGGAVHAHAVWTQGPQTPDESKLQIEWRNGTTHAPAEPPGTFTVTLFMPDMGHGSAPTKIEHMVDKAGQPLVGAYQISDMYFTMGGKWDVNVTLKFADGHDETQTIKVDLAGGGHHH